jgi:hypothetical protein
MPGVDTRGLAAHIIVPQRWCVNVCYHFRVESHINLLEADELWSCGCAEERRACLHPHFGHAEATVRHCCAPLPCDASRLRSTGWAYSCVLQVWWRLLSCFGHYWCYGLHRLEDCGGEDRLLEACADPRVVYVAFGPPCGSFCRSHVNQSMYGLRMLVEDGCPQPGGCFHRKRTELLTNFIALKWLRRTCTRTHEHIELPG